MARDKPGTVQIRHILLDAEVLSSRVKTESIQYEFMTVVISSLIILVRTNDMRLFLLACKDTAIMYLIMTSK